MRVTINGASYALPFLDLLPEHTPDERAALRDSILVHGVQVPILLGISPTHGRIVIDGATRARIAAELSLDPIPSDDMGHVDDATARELAWVLNAHRRHLTPAQRDALIARMRMAGKSVRTISKQTGIPRSTVADRVSGVRLRTPEPDDDDEDEEDEEEYPPPRVLGQDGKSYPARPTRPAPVLGSRMPESIADDAAELQAERLRKHLQAALEEGNKLLTGPRRGRFVRWAATVGIDATGDNWSGMRAAIEMLTELVLAQA